MATSAIKAFAFDFDGVILESAEIKTEAFRTMFAEHPEHVEAVVLHHKANEGISRYEKFRYIYRELLRQPYDDDIETRLDKLFSGIVRQSILECPFVPGAVELLETLSSRAPLYVVSGTPDAELKEIAEARGVDEYFKALLGSSKTKPVRLREVLEDEGVRADELLFVGDAISDFRAASEVGVVFAARVRAGSPDPFPEEGVWAKVEDMAQLSRLLGPDGERGCAYEGCAC